MKMVLAQYTIRSKQEYIFRTNRMVEIAGASRIFHKVGIFYLIKLMK